MQSMMARYEQASTPFSPCFSASSSSPVASSSSPNSCLPSLKISSGRRQCTSPHKITFTPHNAVDWLARCGPDRTDREGFWGRFRNTIKTFCSILETMVEHGIVLRAKVVLPLIEVGPVLDNQQFRTRQVVCSQPYTFY